MIDTPLNVKQWSSDRFPSIIAGLTPAKIVNEISRPSQLLLWRSRVDTWDVEVFYAPFDYVQTTAKVVIVGITPGPSQAEAALKEMQRLLSLGASIEEAEIEAKRHASFAGSIREGIIEAFESTGLSSQPGIGSARDFWSPSNTTAHFTSVLRYPVLANMKRYGGAQPDILDRNFTTIAETLFVDEIRCIMKATRRYPIVVALGAAYRLARAVLMRKKFPPDLIFEWPHFSGENQPNVNIFLRRATASEYRQRPSFQRALKAEQLLERAVAQVAALKRS